MMNTVFGGTIAEKFRDQSAPLIPIIYCHGLSSNRTMHSGTCKDLASHGYIVFILDHHDDTSSFTVRNNGEEVYYNNKYLAYDYEYRRN